MVLREVNFPTITLIQVSECKIMIYPDGESPQLSLIDERSFETHMAKSVLCMWLFWGVYMSLYSLYLFIWYTVLLLTTINDQSPWSIAGVYIVGYKWFIVG